MALDQSKPPVKYMMYCRKSTKGKKRQIHSISGQKRVLKKIIDDEKLIIVDEYDEEKSAHSGIRPGFGEMLSRIEKGEANGILAWEVNRIARNGDDYARVVKLMDNGSLLEIRTAKGVYQNTAAGKGAIGHDLIDAKKYSDNLSEIVKRGNEDKFLVRKQWIGCAKPGYINTKDARTEENTVLPDENRFKLLRKAIDLILSGSHTPMQALHTLNEEYGYRTRQTLNLGGGPLSKSAWQRVLNDSFYYGLMVRSEGEVMGTHTPMITEQEFDLLQVRLGKKGKPRYSKHEYPYKSVLRCGECKGSVTCQEKWQIICPNCKKKFAKAKNRFNCPDCNTSIEEMVNPKILHYIYYSCTHKTNPNCTQKTVKLEDIEAQILAELNLFEIPEEFQNWAIGQLQEVTDKDIETQTTVRENLLAQYTKIDKQIQNCVRQRLDRDPDTYNPEMDEYYNKEESRLLKEKKDLKTQLDKYEVEQEDWIELTKKTFDFACYARYWFEKGDVITKTQILQSLGKNLYLKDGKVLVDGQKPFYLIKKAKEEITQVVAELEPNKKIGDPNYLVSLEPVKTTLRKRWDSNPRTRNSGQG